MQTHELEQTGLQEVNTEDKNAIEGGWDFGDAICPPYIRFPWPWPCPVEQQLNVQFTFF